MERDYFLKTLRLGFSVWNEHDLNLAKLLWGNPEVTKYICASGKFTQKDIENRLALEIENYKKYKVQYFPIFELASSELVGCCGLRPHAEGEFEIGFHLRPEFWRKGFATESAKAIIDYAFFDLHAKSLFAGHNPRNVASKNLLKKLGFIYLRDEFYAPTGLFHPSYKLNNPKL